MLFIRKRHLTAGLLCVALLLCCTTNNPQTAQLPDFELSTRADSTVAVRDSLYIYITTEGEGNLPLTYFLARDDSWGIDSLHAPGFAVAWNFPDTGFHYCIVWAADSTGRRSNYDTLSVRVRSFRPEVQISGAVSASVNEPVLLRCIGKDRDGTILQYEWILDGRVQRITAGDTDSLLWNWDTGDTGCHTISVIAVDQDGFTSEPDTAQVCIELEPPVAILSGTTDISINDTVLFTCRAADTTTDIAEYQWSVDPEGSLWISTVSDSLPLFWRLPDTGLHPVRCRICDDRGVCSAPESLMVHISAAPPAVELHGPHIVSKGDTALFSVSASDSDGSVIRLLWRLSSPDTSFSTTADDTVLRWVWSVNDTGNCRIEVSAVDDDSLHSATVRRDVQIISDLPILLPLPDTTLSITDTLLIRRTIVDSSITAALYFFNTSGADGWDDSSEIPLCTLTYTGATPVTVITGVRSDNGQFFSDTITVSFNRPPQIASASLVNEDTLWCAAANLPGTLPLTVVTTDPDNDTLRTTIIWGRGTSFDTLEYSDTTRLRIDSTGWYTWTITTEDSRGQRDVRNGTTCIGREYTICFAGHSIVAGLINDVLNPSTMGGFRTGVLDGLRDSLDSLERLRPVGPFVTGFMSSREVDDSCFAISGSLALEMNLLLEHAYPALTADIWVLMLGVNGSYDAKETSATHSIIRTIFTRNPNARLYVLTSPPFTQNLSAILFQNYNRRLRDTVSYWAENSYGAHIVEADSVLSNGSTIYDSLFSNDVVHPNQAGYNALRDEILNVMWNSEPPVLEVKHEELF
jgi:hypothetical protein